MNEDQTLTGEVPKRFRRKSSNLCLYSSVFLSLASIATVSYVLINRIEQSKRIGNDLENLQNTLSELKHYQGKSSKSEQSFSLSQIREINEAILDKRYCHQVTASLKQNFSPILQLVGKNLKVIPGATSKDRSYLDGWKIVSNGNCADFDPTVDGSTILIKKPGHYIVHTSLFFPARNAGKPSKIKYGVEVAIVWDESVQYHYLWENHFQVDDQFPGRFLHLTNIFKADEVHNIKIVVDSDLDVIPEGQVSILGLID